VSAGQPAARPVYPSAPSASNPITDDPPLSVGGADDGAVDDGMDAVAIGFVLQLVRALHSYGESAQRLEDVLHAVSERLGLPEPQLFTQPTGIMASFGSLGRQRTHMLRVVSGAVDLEKLAALERVTVDVAHGRSSPAAGIAEIARITSKPSRYGPAITTAAVALASGAACQFLGGGAREVLAATVLGLALALFDLLAVHRRRLAGVVEPLGAFLVSAGAVVLAHAIGPLSVLLATLGGLIVLVPGLALTTALNELASRHLASGTARLSGAFITFFSVAFGVAVGNRVGIAILGAPPAADAVALPGWATVITLVLAPLCFTVIFRAEPRDAPWIVLAGAIGVVGGRVGAALLGAELGAFAGAFALALAARAFERWCRRPAAVVLVPGLLLLVPGTVGFRSLTALMERQVVAGIETAVSALLTAVALVAGLLVASVIAPERQLRDTLQR
jgi:uncharacterized membrane protein YjjP (DUF1212 family)